MYAPFPRLAAFPPSVCSSDAEAARVKKVIKETIVDLMASMAQRVSSSGEGDGEDGQEGRHSSHLHLRSAAKARRGSKGGCYPALAVMSAQAAGEEAKHLIEGRVLGDNVSVVPVVAQPKTVRQLRTVEFEAFMTKLERTRLFSRSWYR